MNVMVTCAICGDPVDPTARSTYQRITGWHRAGRAGGSDIVSRRKLNEFAHALCVDREKSGRTNQGGLF